MADRNTWYGYSVNKPTNTGNRMTVIHAPIRFAILRFGRRTYTALGVGLILTLLSGCGIDHQKEATELAERLYDHIGVQDFSGAADVYGEPFFQRVSRNRWIDTLRQVENNLGPYERHSLIQARHQSFGPSENPGEVFTVLMYRVNYAEQEAIEQLTFSTTQQPIRLVNHQIMSELVAVNLDDPDDHVRIAAATERTAPRATQPAEGPAVESPGEDDLEEADTEEAPLVAETERQTMEERISAELHRITAFNSLPDGPFVEPDPEIGRSVRQLTISGINPSQNRVLIGFTLIKQGEPVGPDLPLTLREVEERRILFQDERGAVYDKWFLTPNR